MEPFVAFRLLAEPQAVTQAFVLFKIDRNVIVLYLVIHTKHQLIQVYVCNTVYL